MNIGGPFEGTDFVVGLYSDNTQMTSKRGENKEVSLGRRRVA